MGVVKTIAIIAQIQIRANYLLHHNPIKYPAYHTDMVNIIIVIISIIFSIQKKAQTTHVMMGEHCADGPKVGI